MLTTNELISKFLANTSHKLIIAFRPLIEGISKETAIMGTAT